MIWAMTPAKKIVKIILNGYDKFFPAAGKEVIIRDLIRRLGKDEKNRI